MLSAGVAGGSRAGRSNHLNPDRNVCITDPSLLPFVLLCYSFTGKYEGIASALVMDVAVAVVVGMVIMITTMEG